jgi:hypothetical protein
MNREFVDAVKKLIEAVTFEQHIDVSGESHFAQQVTIECLDAVLKSIRAAPELSSLHEWVDRQLAGDYDDPGSYQAARYLSDKDIQDAHVNLWRWENDDTWHRSRPQSGMESALRPREPGARL